ncbi:predicted protein, partial [Nematostella vectensis]
KRSMLFVQDGAPAHTAKASQDWCKKNQNGRLTHLTSNPIENLWSIIDEETYRDPQPRTMTSLKSRLKKAWRNVSLSTLSELSHSMPQRL